MLVRLDRREMTDNPDKTFLRAVQAWRLAVDSVVSADIDAISDDEAAQLTARCIAAEDRINNIYTDILGSSRANN
jgi:hypothetical protein